MILHTANIVGPDGAILFRVESTGLSYSVPGISYADKRGKVTACRGCRDEQEALRTARALGRKIIKRHEERGTKASFPDPSVWRLRYRPKEEWQVSA